MVELLSQCSRQAGVGEPENEDTGKVAPDFRIQVVCVLPTTMSTLTLLIGVAQIENLIALDAAK